MARSIGAAVYSGLTLLSPKLNTQLRFLRETGKPADLDDPKTFPEKISWLKLYRYGNDPLVRRCADKLTVRDYVAEQGCGELLNELLGVYDTPEEIPWDTLPNAFALKWNFGSGLNLICRDREKLNPSEAVQTLRRMGRSKFWLLYAELQYRTTHRCILCERYLEAPAGEELLDYKFYCFHGEPMAILVMRWNPDGSKSAIFMNPEWELISDIPAKYAAIPTPERPEALETMREAAAKLSAPFPFVRVDFYEWKGKAIFGEMTFTPAAGIVPSETKLNGKTMGELIHLA